MTRNIKTCPRKCKTDALGIVLLVQTRKIHQRTSIKLLATYDGHAIRRESKQITSNSIFPNFFVLKVLVDPGNASKSTDFAKQNSCHFIVHLCLEMAHVFGSVQIRPQLRHSRCIDDLHVGKRSHPECHAIYFINSGLI